MTEGNFWVDSEYAANYTGYCVDTITRLARSGELTGHQRPSRSGKGHWRFKLTDLDAFLERDAVAGAVVPIDRRRRTG